MDVKLVPESVLNSTKQPGVYIVDDQPSESSTGSAANPLYAKEVKKQPATGKDSTTKPVYSDKDGKSDAAKSAESDAAKSPKSPKPERPNKEAPKKPSGENSISQLLR